MKTIIDKETGEIIEVEENTDLVAKEMNALITDDFIEKLVQVEYLTQQIEMFKAKNKEQIKEIFKKYGIKSFKNDYVTITYVPESKQFRVDNDQLKEDGIYEMYLKEVNVKESIRVKLKGKNDA